MGSSDHVQKIYRLFVKKSDKNAATHIMQSTNYAG